MSIAVNACCAKETCVSNCGNASIGVGGFLWQRQYIGANGGNATDRVK